MFGWQSARIDRSVRSNLPIRVPIEGFNAIFCTRSYIILMYFRCIGLFPLITKVIKLVQPASCIQPCEIFNVTRDTLSVAISGQKSGNFLSTADRIKITSTAFAARDKIANDPRALNLENWKKFDIKVKVRKLRIKSEGVPETRDRWRLKNPRTRRELQRNFTSSNQSIRKDSKSEQIRKSVWKERKIPESQKKKKKIQDQTKEKQIWKLLPHKP